MRVIPCLLTAVESLASFREAFVQRCHCISLFSVSKDVISCRGVRLLFEPKVKSLPTVSLLDDCFATFD